MAGRPREDLGAAGYQQRLGASVDDIVAVVTDLFFQSRILAASRAAGRNVRFLTTDAAVAETNAFGLALVDLDARVNTLSALTHLSGCGHGKLIAFGPHVDTAGRKAAKAAGAGRVLAKSKFVMELPRIVSPGTDGGGTSIHP